LASEVSRRATDAFVGHTALTEVLRGPDLLGGRRVVLAVGALRGPAATQWRGRARCQSTSGQQETRVTVHPVLRPDRQALQVPAAHHRLPRLRLGPPAVLPGNLCDPGQLGGGGHVARSEEHTSELQSRENLVCRLLLEKKKKTQRPCE